MKVLLYGDGGADLLALTLLLAWVLILNALLPPTDNEPQPETIAQLAQEVYAHDLLQLLVQDIWRFEFEVRGRAITPTLSARN